MRLMPSMLIAALLLPSLAAGQVYMWKDASGKTVYSDKPPTEKKTQAREIRRSLPDEQDASAKPPQKPAEQTTSDNGQPTKNPEQLKAESEARDSLCKSARARLAQLESSQGILVTKNQKGEQVPLVGEARKIETEAARRDVDTWCK